MPSHLNGVNQNAIVADDAIMCYMNIRHQQAILSDNGFEFIVCTTADCYAFADYGVITNEGFGFFPRKLKVLWDGRNGSTRINLYIFPNTGAIKDYCVWTNPTAIINNHIGRYGGKWFNGNILANFGIRMYVG